MCDFAAMLFQEAPERRWRRFVFYVALAVFLITGVALAIASGSFG